MSPRRRPATPPNLLRSAVIKGPYRYDLTRTWNLSLPVCGWVMLNPSKADAQDDDPTIRRCVAYAAAWGFGGLVVRNLFALRASNPAALGRADAPIGPDNDGWLTDWHGVKQVVAAWGTGRWPQLHGRAAHVAALLADTGVPVVCLQAGRRGQPMHPLYQRGDLQPQPWPAGRR
jgi:hypothetical protein